MNSHSKHVTGKEVGINHCQGVFEPKTFTFLAPSESEQRHWIQMLQRIILNRGTTTLNRAPSMTSNAAKLSVGSISSHTSRLSSTGFPPALVCTPQVSNTANSRLSDIHTPIPSDISPPRLSDIQTPRLSDILTPLRLVAVGTEQYAGEFPLPDLSVMDIAAPFLNIQPTMIEGSEGMLIPSSHVAPAVYVSSPLPARAASYLAMPLFNSTSPVCEIRTPKANICEIHTPMANINSSARMNPLRSVAMVTDPLPVLSVNEDYAGFGLTPDIDTLANPGHCTNLGAYDTCLAQTQVPANPFQHTLLSHQLTTAIPTNPFLINSPEGYTVENVAVSLSSPHNPGYSSQPRISSLRPGLRQSSNITDLNQTDGITVGGYPVSTAIQPQAAPVSVAKKHPPPVRPRSTTLSMSDI